MSAPTPSESIDLESQIEDRSPEPLTQETPKDLSEEEQPSNFSLRRWLRQFAQHEFRWKPLKDSGGEPTGCYIVSPLVFLRRFLGVTFWMPLAQRGSNHPWNSLLCFISSLSGMLFAAAVFLDVASDSMLVASLGATSVLLYAAPTSPLAQPRNVFIGNTLAGFIGVSLRYAFENHRHLEWLASGLAVSISILLMDITNTMHPPAGATALLPLIGSDAIRDLGFLFVVYPLLISEAMLVFVALLYNNLFTYRWYPVYWY